MTEEQLKVAIIEDEKQLWKMLKMMLEFEGFEVLVATSRQEVEQDILPLAASIAFAIVDGNLTADGTTGNDGKWAIEQLKVVNPEIHTISHSGTNEVERAEKVIKKGKGSVEEIIEYLKVQRSGQG